MIYVQILYRKAKKRTAGLERRGTQHLFAKCDADEREKTCGNRGKEKVELFEYIVH